MQSSFHCLHKPHVYCQQHELTGAPCKILLSAFAGSGPARGRQAAQRNFLFVLLAAALSQLALFKSHCFYKCGSGVLTRQGAAVPYAVSLGSPSAVCSSGAPQHRHEGRLCFAIEPPRNCIHWLCRQEVHGTPQVCAERACAQPARQQSRAPCTAPCKSACSLPPSRRSLASSPSSR